MKIILILVADILKTPPTMSLIQALDDLNYHTTVCTIGKNKEQYSKNLNVSSNIEFEFIHDSYEDNCNIITKFARMFFIHYKLWKIINKLYDDETIIWIVSETSLKHLGKKIITKKYILQMLELEEELYYISNKKLLKMNRKLYTDNAKAIIECEYNRAHITKAWWELKKLPYVLPNKPYISMEIEKKSKISSSESIQNLMENLKDKKIVLYQGNISKERPLDKFIKAVDELGEDWAFVMMLNGENPYPDLKTKNFYFIPFVNPPFHLEITSHAYIGILSYTPIKNSHSILNTLYCAPNKIWEYSKFSIPMISNDLPALKYAFDINKIGKCVSDLSVEKIKQAIKQIDDEYELYSRNSRIFYDSTDFKCIVNKILKEAN